MNEPTSTDTWREVLALFDAWAGASQAGRTQLLAEVKERQPALLARLLAMIEADRAAQSQDFLGGTTPGRLALPAGEPPTAQRAGQRLGAWELQQPIGEGGMGQVWLATRSDGLYSGRAAVKLVQPHRIDAQTDARFAREGEVLARLAHPHIAQLLDAGRTPEGLRYLVLEYVQGQRLDQWCDQRCLPIEARLRLFMQVCDAVGYAHAHLVVHRDLKPANIFVADEGHVKLLDFGVAKLLDDTDGGGAGELTRAGAAGLTPQYAAPEQVSGQPVTTATDVYALGVLLYGLLCGRRPYGSDKSTPAQLARDIVETEPQALDAVLPDADAARARALTPRRLKQRLRGDLAHIVAQALRKAPRERYASAQALADDVQRCLRHEPVHARPPGWRYRTTKFVRRNRMPVAAAALVGLAVTGGAAATWWQAQATQREARRAEGVTNFLTGLLADASVDTRGVKAGEMTVSQMLDSAEQRAAQGLAAQPDVRDQVYLLLTELHTAQGHSERAITIARARVAAAESAFGTGDVRVAPGLIYLAATLLNATEDATQADPLLERAQHLLDAAGDHTSMTRAQLWMWQTFAQTKGAGNGKAAAPWDGNPATKALDLLRARYSGSDEYLIALQFATDLAHRVHDRHADAMAFADEMLSVVRARYGESHGLVSRAMNARAMALKGLKRFDEAYDTLFAARAHSRKYLSESHPDVYTFTASMASALHQAGRHDEAGAMLEEARALVRAHHLARENIVRRLKELEAELAR